ncbi:MAG: hypothetical protein B6I34_02730 [Anaerolineaceae bacterium 4572_32.1]|nr:MAG: hypothetical protein B6I34_02730 [Anaerolineaceae bacterium 4572_32.1]
MRTVEWHQNKVQMVDQRQLPHEWIIVEFDDYQDVARAIKEMYVRGAPAIGATAAFGLALSARQSRAVTAEALLQDLTLAADTLRATRPTAVNLTWALDRLLTRARALAEENAPADTIREALLDEAQALAEEDVAVNRSMGAHGAALVQDGDNILTHCNAGALATVDYGTVLGVANKIGSYKLAVVARENGIPCYSVSPTSTVDLSLPSGDDIPIEERPAREVTHCFGQPVAPEGVQVYNPAFDVTPHRYLTGIVTENGIVYPPLARNLRRAVRGEE